MFGHGVYIPAYVYSFNRFSPTSTGRDPILWALYAQRKRIGKFVVSLYSVILLHVLYSFCLLFFLVYSAFYFYFFEVFLLFHHFLIKLFLVLLIILFLLVLYFYILLLFNLLLLLSLLIFLLPPNTNSHNRAFRVLKSYDYNEQKRLLVCSFNAAN